MTIKKEFRAGRGYSKEDWDAVDSPELTDTEIASMRPAKEVLPPEFFKAVETARRMGRPRIEAPKQAVTLRLSPDTVEKFKRSGDGWRSKMAEMLDKAKVG
jgi:uncharacterized protein (DUF4415 family)